MVNITLNGTPLGEVQTMAVILWWTLPWLLGVWFALSNFINNVIVPILDWMARKVNQ